MAKSSRGVVWLIVLLLAAAAAFRISRCQCSSDELVGDARVDAARLERDAARQSDAAVAVADAVVAEPAAPSLDLEAASGFDIDAISADGTRALLYRKAHEPGDVPAFRVVATATGKTEAEVELPTFSFRGVDDPTPPATEAEVAVDAATAFPLLKRFPLGAGSWIAAADDANGAFNVGDPTFLVANGKLGPKVARPAAYAPMVLPDGKTLLVRGYDGQFAGMGTGRYSLFAMPLVGGKPEKVATTEGFSSWRLSRDGKMLRIVVSDPKYVPTCVLEIPLVKPFKVSRRRCLEGDEGHFQISSGGAYVAWRVGPRLRVLDVARGNVTIDREASPSFLIGDGGRLLIEEGNRYRDIDGATERVVDLPARTLLSCHFHLDSLLVCLDGDTVKRIDLASR